MLVVSNGRDWTCTGRDGGWLRNGALTDVVKYSPDWALPFRHIVAGAASGSWFQGDFNVDGNPMALQSLGGPPGMLMLEFDGTDYVERYVGARIDPARRMWAGLNTPAFRDWFEALVEWKDADEQDRHPLPPYSINDLPETGVVTPDDLAEGVWLTANVWDGSSETAVTAATADGREWSLERSRAGDGEIPNIGAAWADPFAAARQLSVVRYPTPAGWATFGTASSFMRYC